MLHLLLASLNISMASGFTLILLVTLSPRVSHFTRFRLAPKSIKRLTKATSQPCRRTASITHTAEPLEKPWMFTGPQELKSGLAPACSSSLKHGRLWYAALMYKGHTTRDVSGRDDGLGIPVVKWWLTSTSAPYLRRKSKTHLERLWHVCSSLGSIPLYDMVANCAWMAWSVQASQRF